MSEFLDHIIWACDDLERGFTLFRALTGVEPRYGGMHASGVTHNALVGLGNRSYLEILAPVKAQGPEDDEWTRLARAAREPRVLTYSMRSAHPLSELSRIAAARGWKNADVASNGRTTPDGVRLRWQWLAPVVEPFGLAFPFFIDWLDSPHPSESSRPLRPKEGALLRSFVVGHPDAQHLRQVLAELGSPIDTYASSGVEFQVSLDTPKGLVSL